jgi:hypothetical protein
VPTDHKSQSEHDWAYAKRALARGDDPEVVIQRIADYRSEDKDDSNYYARHTGTKAQADLHRGKTVWTKTLRRATIPYFRTYDLRSAYATRLSAGGVADEWVTQLLRRSDAQVFKKYPQMKLRMKREALEKLNSRPNEMAPEERPMLFRRLHCVQRWSNDVVMHSSCTVCTNKGAFGPR